MRLDHRRIKVTVHESDMEAKEIWARDHGKNAYVCNSEHNFWSMGNDAGLPCGPCTEIYYDFTDHIDPKVSNNLKNSDLLPPDDDNCMEIWNLVFMQYKHHGIPGYSYDWNPDIWEKLDGGNCVDTGMGLERLASVVQGVHNSNFQIDSLQTMIHHTRNVLSSAIEKDIPYADFNDPDHLKPIIHDASVSIRIIVDHLRSAS